MAAINLDFQEYVRARRGAEEARQREGAAYAYSGDLRLVRATERIRPVSLAVEAVVRLWKGGAEERLLGEGTRVDGDSHPEVTQVAEGCAATLHLPLPEVYLVPRPRGPGALTLGTHERPYVLLSEHLVEELHPPELAHVMGGAFGHIHNRHTVFLTVLHFLGDGGGRLVSWATRPATLALQTWARRAEVTADRAGLLCSKDLGASMAAILIQVLGSRRRFDELSGSEYLEPLGESNEPLAKFGELCRANSRLGRRLEALRIFSRSAYFRGALGQDGGLSTATCDAQVQRLGT